MNETARIAIVTISDRASRGDYEDRAGPEIRRTLERYLRSPWEALARLVPDERQAIEAALRELADREGCCLILTSGGTGPAPRDVTPEATEAVCEKILPGFGEAMRAVSRPAVPTAILSRQCAGIRARSLIINLPGNPRAVPECLGAVFAAVPDCIDLLGGPRLETDPEVLKAYRPGEAP